MPFYRILLILCACALTFAGKGWAQTTLIIATSELPPYVSENPKDSFLTDVLQAVADQMGVRFVFKFMPWKRCELAVEKLEAWGAVPYVLTPEREAKFYFSKGLYNKKSKFFLHASGGKRRAIVFSTLADLRGLRIGGVAGYYYEQEFADAGLEVEYVATEEQNFRKLEAGRVDLVAADEMLGWHFIHRLFSARESASFYTLQKPLNTSAISLMTSKRYPGTEALLADFNSALEAIKKNGTYQRILNKHGVAFPSTETSPSGHRDQGNRMNLVQGPGTEPEWSRNLPATWLATTR